MLPLCNLKSLATPAFIIERVLEMKRIFFFRKDRQSFKKQVGD